LTYIIYRTHLGPYRVSLVQRPAGILASIGEIAYYCSSPKWTTECTKSV